MLRRPMALQYFLTAAAFVGVACSGGGSGAAPTNTAGPVSTPPPTTPSATPWNPVYGYDPGTSTGVAVADSVMAEISGRDLDALASRALTFSSPCSTDENVATANRCPAGATPGTLVEVVHASFCAGSVAFPVSEAKAMFRPLLDGFPRLWGLRELTPGVPASKQADAPLTRYVLFVVNNSDPPVGFTLMLGADGQIHDVGYGCHDRPETVWGTWTDGVGVLAPPATPEPR